MSTYITTAEGIVAGFPSERAVVHPSGGAETNIEQTVVEYYRATPGISPTQIVELAMLVLTGAGEEVVDEDVAGAMCSIFNALFPVEFASASGNSLILTGVPVPADIIAVATGQAQPMTAGPNPAPYWPAILRSAVELQGPIVGGEVNHARHLFGILVYAIGKEPTDNNMRAFTDTRRTVARRILGLAPGDASGPLGTYYPTAVAFKRLHSSLHRLVSVRKAIVRRVCEWRTKDVSDARRMVLAHADLLREVGLLGITLGTRLVLDLPSVVMGNPILAGEARAFREDVLAYAGQQPFEKLYRKAIEGPDYVPLRKEGVQNLLGAARAYATVTRANFRNTTLGQMSPAVSAYMTMQLAARGLTQQ